MSANYRQRFEVSVSEQPLDEFRQRGSWMTVVGTVVDITRPNLEVDHKEICAQLADTKEAWYRRGGYYLIGVGAGSATDDDWAVLDRLESQAKWFMGASALRSSWIDISVVDDFAVALNLVARNFSFHYTSRAAE